jgi:hypothetical protein
LYIAIAKPCLIKGEVKKVDGLRLSFENKKML